MGPDNDNGLISKTDGLDHAIAKYVDNLKEQLIIMANIKSTETETGEEVLARVEQKDTMLFWETMTLQALNKGGKDMH